MGRLIGAIQRRRLADLAAPFWQRSFRLNLFPWRKVRDRKAQRPQSVLMCCEISICIIPCGLDSVLPKSHSWRCTPGILMRRTIGQPVCRPISGITTIRQISESGWKCSSDGPLLSAGSNVLRCRTARRSLRAVRYRPGRLAGAVRPECRRMARKRSDFNAFSKALQRGKRLQAA